MEHAFGGEGRHKNEKKERLFFRECVCGWMTDDYPTRAGAEGELLEHILGNGSPTVAERKFEAENPEGFQGEKDEELREVWDMIKRSRGR